MAETLVCRGCGGECLSNLGVCAPSAWQIEYRWRQDPGQLYRCKSCFLVQRFPVPSDAELKEMYQETPATEWAYPFEDNAAWVQARKLLLQRFEHREPPSVLDIGCHTGLFLQGLPETWRRHGIEGGFEPSRIASSTNRVTIIADRLESDLSSWHGKFDAVTMFDVAEHLLDPLHGILRASALLKPGGVLLLSTANFDSWPLRWLRGQHWYLQTPQHLSGLSPSFVAQVARKHRLRVLDVRRTPHKLASLRERTQDTIKLTYWGMRQRGGMYRIPQRILHGVPGLGHLRHMVSPPWTMSLRDHFLAMLQSEAEPQPVPSNA